MRKISRRALIKGGLAISGAAIAAGVAAPFVVPRRRGNILVITVDALRADKIGRTVNGREVMPNLNRLAGENVCFENAFSTSSFTKESMASIISGRYPPYHGVEQGYQALPRIPTIFTDAKEAGYNTFFINTNPWLYCEQAGSRREQEKVARGFGVGVDCFIDVRQQATAGGEHPYAFGGDVNVRLFRALEGAAATPMMALAHYMDVHDPFLRGKPSKYTGAFHGGDALRRLGAEGVYQEDLRVVKRGYMDHEPLKADEYATITAVNDEAAAQADEYLGKAFAGMKRLGLYDRATIIVTADHGEELGEHGGVGHAKTLYNESIAVPLVIKTPGGACARVKRRVSNVYVRRCLLELTNRAAADDDPLAQSLLDSGESGDAEILSCLGLFDMTKLIGPDGIEVLKEGGKAARYDITKDPREKNGSPADAALAARPAKLTDFLRYRARADRVVTAESNIAWQWVYRESELLKRFETDPSSLDEQLRRVLTQKKEKGETLMDDATAKQLRALGYLGH